MKSLIIYCHPNPQSFNHAVLETVSRELQPKGEIRVKDLYQMNWNPVLGPSDFEKLFSGQANPDVAQEQNDIRWADLLVFIFPIWWNDRPALLKGWIDRVLSAGFAYQMTAEGVQGLLGGKKALVITTSGGDQKTMEDTGILAAFKSTVVQGTLNFCGINDVTYKNCFAVPAVSDEERKKYLEEITALVKKL